VGARGLHTDEQGLGDLGLVRTWVMSRSTSRSQRVSRYGSAGGRVAVPVVSWSRVAGLPPVAVVGWITSRLVGTLYRLA
jgi:hypothetical protein